MMEGLVDDLLALIVSKIDDPHDRKSFSQVCKRWFRVEGLQRSTLRVFEPELLPNFLPRFPNLVKFEASVAISNSSIQFLSSSCPRLQFINLNCDDPLRNMLEDCLGDGDIDDEGLRDIAKGFRDLETVLLSGRSAIGDLGVASLVGFSRNLRNLDLGFSVRVSDEALKSIAGLNNLEMLNLQECWWVTDIGLTFLTEGPVCNTLITLNLDGCDQITDQGLINLRNMGALEELNLARCGSMVTDRGIEIGVAANCSMKKLNLSWLVNVNDLSLVALARSCWSLEVLDLTGCGLIPAVGVRYGLISGIGIRALSSHPCLKKLVLICCDISVSGDDLEYLVSGCSSLECIVLDKSSWMRIPTSVIANILRQNCVLAWE